MNQIYEQLEGLYFYSFTSGSYDDYSHDGTYVSLEKVTDAMWYEHLDEWNAERNRLTGLIPLKTVTFGNRERQVRDTDGPEAAALRTHFQNGPDSTFIAKYSMVQLEESADFHKD